MKFLLLLGVLLVALLWWTLARRRNDADRAPGAGGDSADKGAAKGRSRGADVPAPMLACAHCGVHLPQAEAAFDAGGRPYCSEAHRLAGPG